jgi:catechol 2,3-dioxygenase-like lactoylglutathione lyase family enzyme
MTVERMDHVGIVVDDLDHAIAYFTELGLKSGGKMEVDGAWVDRVVGLEGVRVEISMMRTPDGHSRLELTKFLAPAVATGQPYPAPANTLGLRRIMFAVDDIRDVVRRLRKHGGELIGDIAQYEDAYLLCYLRGPSGIIVALAEAIS